LHKTLLQFYAPLREEVIAIIIVEEYITYQLAVREDITATIRYSIKPSSVFIPF